MQTSLTLLALLVSSRQVLAAKCTDVATAGGWEGIASISVSFHLRPLLTLRLGMADV